jgi:hypothetical protein
MPHDHTNNPTHPNHDLPGDPLDRDLLISRVVDGRATAAEWTALESLAGREPAVWRDLATAQRDQRAIEMLVGSAGDVAESVDLPMASTGPAVVTTPMSRLRLWGGWVAAAVMAVAFVAQFRSANSDKPLTDPNPISQGAGLIPVNYSADEALDLYRNKGREEGIVLGEVPDQVLLAAEPAPDGRGYTVMFVRQIVEKRHVNDVVRFHTKDEAGNIVPIPQRLPDVRGRSVR